MSLPQESQHICSMRAFTCSSCPLWMLPAQRKPLSPHVFPAVGHADILQSALEGYSGATDKSTFESTFKHMSQASLANLG